MPTTSVQLQPSTTLFGGVDNGSGYLAGLLDSFAQMSQPLIGGVDMSVNPQPIFGPNVMNVPTQTVQVPVPVYQPAPSQPGGMELLQATAGDRRPSPPSPTIRPMDPASPMMDFAYKDGPKQAQLLAYDYAPNDGTVSDANPWTPAQSAMPPIQSPAPNMGMAPPQPRQPMPGEQMARPASFSPDQIRAPYRPPSPVEMQQAANAGRYQQNAETALNNLGMMQGAYLQPPPQVMPMNPYNRGPGMMGKARGFISAFVDGNAARKNGGVPPMMKQYMTYNQAMQEQRAATERQMLQAAASMGMVGAQGWVNMAGQQGRGAPAHVNTPADYKAFIEGAMADAGVHAPESKGRYDALSRWAATPLAAQDPNMLKVLQDMFKAELPKPQVQQEKREADKDKAKSDAKVATATEADRIAQSKLRTQGMQQSLEGQKLTNQFAKDTLTLRENILKTKQELAEIDKSMAPDRAAHLKNILAKDLQQKEKDLEDSAEDMIHDYGRLYSQRVGIAKAIMAPEDKQKALSDIDRKIVAGFGPMDPKYQVPKSLVAVQNSLTRDRLKAIQERARQRAIESGEVDTAQTPTQPKSKV